MLVYLRLDAGKKLVAANSAISRYWAVVRERSEALALTSGLEVADKSSRHMHGDIDVRDEVLVCAAETATVEQVVCDELRVDVLDTTTIELDQPVVGKLIRSKRRIANGVGAWDRLRAVLEEAPRKRLVRAIGHTPLPFFTVLPAQPFLLNCDASIMLDSKVDGKLRRNPGERARDCHFDYACCVLRIVRYVIDHRVHGAGDARWKRVNDLRDAIAEERAVIHMVEAVLGMNLTHYLPQLPCDRPAVAIVPVLVGTPPLPRDAKHSREILDSRVKVDVHKDQVEALHFLSSYHISWKRSDGIEQLELILIKVRIQLLRRIPRLGLDRGVFWPLEVVERIAIMSGGTMNGSSHLLF